MESSKLIYVDARIVMPVESAHLFGDDPTVETEAGILVMDTVPGASQIFVAGQLGAEPVLDIYLEGDEAGTEDLSMILLELDGQLMALMSEAGTENG